LRKLKKKQVLKHAEKAREEVSSFSVPDSITYEGGRTKRHVVSWRRRGRQIQIDTQGARARTRGGLETKGERAEQILPVGSYEEKKIGPRKDSFTPASESAKKR